LAEFDDHGTSFDLSFDEIDSARQTTKIKINNIFKIKNKKIVILVYVV
jgi:hypothetical protein